MDVIKRSPGKERLIQCRTIQDYTQVVGQLFGRIKITGIDERSRWQYFGVICSSKNYRDCVQPESIEYFFSDIILTNSIFKTKIEPETEYGNCYSYTLLSTNLYFLLTMSKQGSSFS